MINRVVLVGRLTKDPEVRMTNTQKMVVSFTLAVNRRGKDKGADFIGCVAWEHTAEYMSKYLHKGNLIAADGHIQTRTYDDKNQKKVYVTEVVCETVQGLEHHAENQEQAAEPVYAAPQTNEVDPNDLPF